MIVIILSISCGKDKKSRIVPSDTDGKYDTGSEKSYEFYGFTFVSIPGGTFEMGDRENAGSSDEKPVHTVTLDGFEMSAYEITQGQYQEIMGENSSYFSGDDTLPVEQVRRASFDFPRKLNGNMHAWQAQQLSIIREIVKVILDLRAGILETAVQRRTL